jgi:CheY-like chemotaxis protein
VAATMRILLIDDNKELRWILTQMLHDYTVFEAQDGREGLELFLQHRPELVITDMIMPQMGGVETIQALSQHFPLPKIIAISGGGGAPAANWLWIAQELGANRTLMKPFGRRELLQTVEEVLAA